MTLSEIAEITEVKNQLQEMIAPFQEEQHRRQRQSDFMKKCILCVEKDDFFHLDNSRKTLCHTASKAFAR
jgi:hypothetical protein